MSQNYDINNQVNIMTKIINHYELKANKVIIISLGVKSHIYEILSHYDKTI